MSETPHNSLSFVRFFAHLSFMRIVNFLAKAPRSVALGLLIASIVILGLFASDRVVERRTVATERQRLSNVAALAAIGLQQQIDKFQLVATTLSGDPDVRTLLFAPTPAQKLRVNTRLAELTSAVDASVIFLLDAGGTTIASGNWQQIDSFMDQNYAFRSYFKQAMQDGRSQQYALGTRSRIPGLFLSLRIDGPNGPLGVLVVKIRFDQIEREWARSAGPSFVTNETNIILVSSDPSWRFQTTRKLSPAARAVINRQQEYGDATLSEQPDYALGRVLQSGAYKGQALIEATRKQANGWTVHVLAPLKPAITAARNIARLLVALLLALVMGGWAAFALRNRARKLKDQREHRARIDEIKERLAHANRLSTLGQIAAGVGHELNQPLTTIALRADSARKMIKIDQTAAAEAALRDITSLVERAGAITLELRDFARRKDGGEAKASVAKTFEGLKLLLGDRIRTQHVQLELKLQKVDHIVVAHQGKLEQILVNLVQNSLDAVGNNGWISIEACGAESMIHITVSDSGPGIDAKVSSALFQPFSTIKSDGMGLGLVISRDIATEFGGELILLSSEKGAQFQLRLKAAS